MDQDIGKVVIIGFFALLVAMLGWCSQYMIGSGSTPSAQELMTETGLEVVLIVNGPALKVRYETGDEWTSRLPKSFEGQFYRYVGLRSYGMRITGQRVPNDTGVCATVFGLPAELGAYAFTGEFFHYPQGEKQIVVFCVTGRFYRIGLWDGVFRGQFGFKDGNNRIVVQSGSAELAFMCDDEEMCIAYIKHKEALLRGDVKD